MSARHRVFVIMIGLGAASVALPLPNVFSAGDANNKKPNIIFIMSDDHPAQAISCYSKELIDTPNIDRIADEGIIFKNCFVTNSLCAPSRAVQLTGKYSHINGLLNNSSRYRFDGSQTTFPKLLQKAGYQTAIVGKWHLRTKPTGFDNWKVLIGQGHYYNPVLVENGVKKQYTGYVTDIITDKAIEALEQRDRNKPFCLLVHNKATHGLWMPNLKHLGKLNDKTFPLPKTFYDDYANRLAAEKAIMRIADMAFSSELMLKKKYYGKEVLEGRNARYLAVAEDHRKRVYERLTDEQKKAWDAHYDAVGEQFQQAKLSGKDLTEWKYQRHLKDILECVLSVDENVGRLLDYLDKSGLAEDTIVIYTSDQGYFLGEHGWSGKQFMYEESLRTPFVMRYPREIKAGQASENMALNLDFAPTLLDYAGVDVPDEMQGESLRPLARGLDPDDWRTSMYYRYYSYGGRHMTRGHYGIRTQRYKLIYFSDDIKRWELYDLEKDPHEINNLYDDPAYADVIKDLKAELDALRLKYGDKDGGEKGSRTRPVK